MSDDQPRMSVKQLAGRFNNMTQQSQPTKPPPNPRKSEVMQKPPEITPRNSETLPSRNSI